MRVTSNLYTQQFKEQMQFLQESRFASQRRVSTGLQVEKPSDNPALFKAAQLTQINQASIKAYQVNTREARSITETNYQAMTDLHRTLSRVSEVATRASNVLNSSDLQILGSEVGVLLDQVVSIVNREKNGNYLFGGTANERPLDPTTYAYNAATNAQETTAEIQENQEVTTSVLAGRSGAPPVDGFLFDQTDGIDIINTLITVRDQLNLGDANSVQNTGIPELGTALSHVSQFIGRTAAFMERLDLNDRILDEQELSGAERFGELTNVDMAEAISELQNTQFHYQAALQSGAQILRLSLMNFL